MLKKLIKSGKQKVLFFLEINKQAEEAYVVDQYQTKSGKPETVVAFKDGRREVLDEQGKIKETEIKAYTEVCCCCNYPSPYHDEQCYHIPKKIPKILYEEDKK